MCCGRDNGRSGRVTPARRTITAASASPAGRRAPGAAHFEYVGATGMTVVGPASGRRYRFEGTGSRLSVDPADKASLAAIPNLRQVAGL